MLARVLATGHQLLIADPTRFDGVQVLDVDERASDPGSSTRRQTTRCHGSYGWRLGRKPCASASCAASAKP